MMNTEDRIKETYNDVEILCTPRTINNGLVLVTFNENDDAKMFNVTGLQGSDIIIHVLRGAAGPEEYIHVKSGNVVAVRPFMYTKRYLKCRVDKNGRLRAVI